MRRDKSSTEINDMHCLVEQETASIAVSHRQGDDFSCETYQGLDAILPLPEVETSLPLAEIYEGVEFSPEQPLDESELL